MVCIYHFMYQYWLLDTLVFAFKKGKKLINETVFIRPLLYGIIDKKLAKETVFIKPLLYSIIDKKLANDCLHQTLTV